VGEISLPPLCVFLLFFLDLVFDFFFLCFVFDVDNNLYDRGDEAIFLFCLCVTTPPSIRSIGSPFPCPSPFFFLPDCVFLFPPTV